MDKNTFASSQQEHRSQKNEEHIVRYIPDYDAPLTPEMLAQLEHVRNMRDEDIDLSDAPPLPGDGGWVRARDLGFAWAQPRPGQRASRKKDAA
jgi:hypothetical protein